MIDRYEGYIGDKTQSFSRFNPNQKRSDKSGSYSHGNGIYFFQICICKSQCFINDRYDAFDLLAGSLFRNDAAVFFMQGGRRGNYIGKNLPTITEEGSRRFITGSLNTKY